MTDATTTRTIRVEVPWSLYRQLQVISGHSNQSTGAGSIPSVVLDIVRQHIRREVEIGATETVTKAAMRRAEAASRKLGMAT